MTEQCPGVHLAAGIEGGAVISGVRIHLRV